jgi:hypothetical protein
MVMVLNSFRRGLSKDRRHHRALFPVVPLPGRTSFFPAVESAAIPEAVSTPARGKALIGIPAVRRAVTGSDPYLKKAFKS